MYNAFIMWLFGYYQLEILSNSNRLIKLLTKQNIRLNYIKKANNHIIIRIAQNRIDDFKTFAQKTQSTYNILDKRGLFVYFHKLTKRLWFLLGLLFFVICILYTNSLIWDIKVIGCNQYTQNTIKRAVSSKYIPIATSKNKINCSKLEQQLRNDFKNIAWISCDIQGTKLTIDLSETNSPNENEKQNTPSNIVAAKDGIITDIIATSGKCLHQKGDVVKKGDILITGVINVCNEYDELIETKYVNSTGNVYAITEYNYNDYFDLDYFDKKSNMRKKSKHYLKIFNQYLFTPRKFASSANTIQKNIKLGNTYYLPITIFKEDITKYEFIPKTYNQAEATKKANNKLNFYINELRKKNVEILQNNVKIYFENGKCISKGKLKVKELIGIPSKLEIIEEQGD